MRIPPVKLGQSAIEQARNPNSMVESFERMLEQVQQTGVEHLEQVAQLASLAQFRMLSALVSVFNESETEDAGMSFMQAWGNLNQAVVEPPAAALESKPLKPDVTALIDKAAETHGVDSDLIRAVIKAESGFDPQATSPKGAMGLMQLMPATAKGLGVSNAYDPEQNIMAGTRFLKSLLKRYEGDIARALAAYNWGPGNVERHPDRLPLETKNYIARITADYRKQQS